MMHGPTIHGVACAQLLALSPAIAWHSRLHFRFLVSDFRKCYFGHIQKRSQVYEHMQTKFADMCANIHP